MYKFVKLFKCVMSYANENLNRYNLYGSVVCFFLCFCFLEHQQVVNVWKVWYIFCFIGGHVEENGEERRGWERNVCMQYVWKESERTGKCEVA